MPHIRAWSGVGSLAFAAVCLGLAASCTDSGSDSGSDSTEESGSGGSSGADDGDGSEGSGGTGSDGTTSNDGDDGTDSGVSSDTGDPTPGIRVPAEWEPQEAIYDNAADLLEQAGFEVIRWPFEASVTHQSVSYDTDYLNWLVGNGFVITVGFGHAQADANAKTQLEQWFPGRDVYVIEMLESWAAGGGVHCHTNDQPAG